MKTLVAGAILPLSDLLSAKTIRSYQQIPSIRVRQSSEKSQDRLSLNNLARMTTMRSLRRLSRF